MTFTYDVALSFAGEQRKDVEQVAACLRAAGLNVFYDDYEKADLWGKDLYVHLSDVYQHKARYCIIFSSKDYAEKQWTNHERQNAQARALSEKGNAYILPVRFDDTDVPGILPTIGYLDFRREGAEGVCRAFLNKIGATTAVAHKPAEAIQKLRPFPAAEPQNSPNFRLPGNPLGRRINPSPIGPPNGQAIFLAQGPAIWLRLMPITDPGKTWPPYELKKAAFMNNRILLEPLCQRGLYSLRAEDGFGHCALNSDDASETSGVAFAFVTGEVWSVDSLLLSLSGNSIPFLEKYFTEGIERYGRFLAGLGIKPPYHWIAGVTDVKGRHLSIPPPSGRMNFPGMMGPECMSAAILEKGLYDGVQTPTSALLPFFNKIFDKCDTPRPSHLPG